MQKTRIIKQRTNKEFINQKNRRSMKRKMNVLVMLLALCGSIFFLTGCQDDEAVIDEGTDIESTQSLMSDDEFESLVSGKVIYPEDMELTETMKKYLIYEAQNVPQTFIENKILPSFSREDLLLIDEDRFIEEEIIDVEEYPMSDLKNNAQMFSRLSTTSMTSPRGIKIPHHYEFDRDENPSQYGWCGHTVLQCVAEYHGQYKSLQKIHTAFWKNSAKYREDRCSGGPYHYCASLSDLLWASNNQNGNSTNYNFPASSLEQIGSIGRFYQRIVDGIEYGKPVILTSAYPYGASDGGLHFYPVIGYKTIRKSSGDIDYSKSKLYLRDVARNKRNEYYKG